MQSINLWNCSIEADQSRMIILDFDNTMFHTDHAIAELTKEVLLKFQCKFTEPSIYDHLGKTTLERMHQHGLKGDKAQEAAVYFKKLHENFFPVELCTITPGLESFLSINNCKIVIMSLTPEKAIQETLKRYGISNHIDGILSTQNIGSDSKEYLLTNHYYDWEKVKIVVGDSEADFGIAQKLRKEIFCIQLNESCYKMHNYNKPIFINFYDLMNVLRGPNLKE